MEDTARALPATPDAVISAKSWIAYVRPLFLGLVVALVAGLVAFFGGPVGQMVAAALAALDLVFVGYRVALLRSFKVYQTPDGIWVTRGILPWNKGIYGMRWRDMEKATFETGFWSWLSRSYNIRIAHRFTRESEIRLQGVSRGREVTELINNRLAEMARAGTLS